MTDANGYFRFENITPGSHRLRAAIDTLPADLIFTDAELLVVAMPYRVNRQDFRAIPTGQIQGTVTIVTMDETGERWNGRFRTRALSRRGAGHVFRERRRFRHGGYPPPGTYQLRLDASTLPAGYTAKPAIVTVEVKPGQSTGGVAFQLARPVIVIKPALAAAR